MTSEKLSIFTCICPHGWENYERTVSYQNYGMNRDIDTFFRLYFFPRLYPQQCTFPLILLRISRLKISIIAYSAFFDSWSMVYYF